MKVVHIITSLGQGGAESTLTRLIHNGSNPRNHTVISLTGDGIYGKYLRSAGATVFTLRQKPGRFSIGALKQIRSICKEVKAEVVQTWMYHSDLIGALAVIGTDIPVVWGVRHSDNSIKDLGLKTWLVAKVCAFFSFFIPKFIISCSQKSIEMHRRFGYADKFVYVPNGFEIKKTDSLMKQIQDARNVFGLLPESIVFGHVARFHPSKGHLSFMKAVSIISLNNKSVTGLMAGSGVSFDDLTFSRLVPHNLKKYIKVIGPQSNIQLVYDACDCFVLSSETEAFPNVVAEAMLSGLPCIVTDVGDAAEIVGDTGWVVSSNSLDELVDAMGEVLTAMKNSREWIRRKELSRERIEQNYSIQKMQDQFNVVWKMAVGNKLCVE